MQGWIFAFCESLPNVFVTMVNHIVGQIVKLHTVRHKDKEYPLNEFIAEVLDDRVR